MFGLPELAVIIYLTSFHSIY